MSHERTEHDEARDKEVAAELAALETSAAQVDELGQLRAELERLCVSLGDMKSLILADDSWRVQDAKDAAGKEADRATIKNVEAASNWEELEEAAPFEWKTAVYHHCPHDGIPEVSRLLALIEETERNLGISPDL